MIAECMNRTGDLFTATCANSPRCPNELRVPREGRDEHAWERAIDRALRRGRWDAHADSNHALCYYCSGRAARDARRARRKFLRGMNAPGGAA